MSFDKENNATGHFRKHSLLELSGVQGETMINQSLTIHAKTWCKEISFVVCGLQKGYTYITVKLFSQVKQ